MTRGVLTLYQFLVVSFVIVNEINAQFQCSGRWAYICEGRRRALKTETEIRLPDVPVESVDEGDRLAASTVREDNESEEEPVPEWFLNLVAKSRQPIAEVDIQRSKSIDSPPSLSRPVAVPHQRDSIERAYGVNEDDVDSGRRRRLEELARRLVSIDGVRREDTGHESNGGLNEIYKIYKERAPSTDQSDAATKKRLLSKWLEEDGK